MEVIPDEEALDAIPLAVKSPSIVDWKIHKEGKKSYYQIIKADGNSKMYLVFNHMLKSFDREDLKTLYKLVKAKYGSTRPVENLDLVLYGDLKTMFEPHVEDNGRIVRIKRLIDDLRLTAAQVCVTGAKLKSCQYAVSKAYIVRNKETVGIEESLNVTFDESLPEPKSSSLVEDDRINKPIVQDLNRSPSF
ncbi:hypothetical protein Tco_0873923 [Tanacetum coccineum]|uniref:Uncharacterized protein n=1 Tax=Tanacetum coccineum TaxID=301880 RepID=A0ABQ5BN08_9ASTR